MASTHFIYTIVDSNGKVVGCISASRSGATPGELKRQWAKFLKWRAEAALRSVVTEKEKRLLDDDIGDAFGQFLYLQASRDGAWSYGAHPESVKGILKMK